MSDICQRCEGDGLAHGSDRPFEWHGPGTYPGPCPVCKGSGKSAACRRTDALTTEVKETNTPQRHPTFQEELEHLINCHSIENESDTPDFILAEYLRNCLTTWRTATRRRDNWYGHKTLNTGSLKSNPTEP